MNKIYRQNEQHTRLKRGYVTSLGKERALKFKKRYTRNSVFVGTCLGLFYLGVLYTAASLPLIVTQYFNAPALMVFGTFVASALITARQMRALENVVHFGSHYNFSANPKVNDLLVNVLAAWPMLSDVRTYRRFHNAHHGRYGSKIDPCRQRFSRMGVTAVDFSTRLRLMLAVLRWLPSYTSEYYRDVGSNRAQILTFVLWHAMSFSLISMFTPDYAVTIALVWIVGMFIVLPVLRSIAEVSEHDYDLGESEFATTFNNIGLMDQWLLHPAGDAWHLLHHLYPRIPWWKQRNAHNFLMKYDNVYQQGLHRASILKDCSPNDFN